MIITAIVSTSVAFAIVLAVLWDLFNPLSSSMHPLRFRLSRLITWFPTGLMYALFYMARYNVSSGRAPSVLARFDVKEEDFNFLLTCGFWTYAFTAPLTGSIADRIGGRNAVLVASSGCAVSNLVAGCWLYLGHPIFPVLPIVYCLNMMFQGFGTSSVVKINACWYTSFERAVFSGIYNVMITSGYYLALGGCPAIITAFGFEYCFLIPAALMAVCFFVMAAYLSEAPGDELGKRKEEKKTAASLPASEQALLCDVGDAEDVEKASLLPKPNLLSMFDPPEEAPAPSSHYIPPPPPPPSSSPPSDNIYRVDEIPPYTPPSPSPFSQLLSNPTFFCYCISIFCLCWVRDGLITWVQKFIAESRNEETIDPSTAAVIGGAITWGGFCGGILCGLVSDYVFKSSRNKPIILFSFLQAVTLAALYLLRASSDAIVGLLVFATSVFLLGNYTLLSYTVPSDLPAEVVATAAGAMTFTAYIASGLSGFAMAGLIDRFGYVGWLISLEIATVLGCCAIGIGSFFASRAKFVALVEEEVRSRFNTDVSEIELNEEAGLDREFLEKAVMEAIEQKRNNNGGGGEASTLSKAVAMAIIGSAESVLEKIGDGAYSAYNNGDQKVTLFSIGFESQVVALKEGRIHRMQMSGVQDEFLRRRLGDDAWHLWTTAGTPGERAMWRIDDGTMSPKTKLFFGSRKSDRNSYFGRARSEKSGFVGRVDSLRRNAKTVGAGTQEGEELAKAARKMAMQKYEDELARRKTSF